MSNTSTEIPRDPNRREHIGVGTHPAYVFDTSAEKQSKLFALCQEIISSGNSSVLYIAGKQGVIGIRLSLKDIGFDVSFYERSKQLRIVDSEEWFLTSGRQQQFLPIPELEQRLKVRAQEAVQSGFRCLTVISETDMLVRKGFLPKYKEFDDFLAREIKEFGVAFVCAFDRRELQAAGVRDVDAEVSASHSFLL
jgi:hypothetical protein